MNFDNWDFFLVSDIFDNLKIKRYQKIPTKIGSVPFVSSISNNNGIVKLCTIKANQNHAITVSTNGDCFDCFWHPYEFCASTDVEILNCKNHIMSDNQALFICTVLRRNKEKYWYNFKPKSNKVWETKIMLPAKIINGQKVPDWNFMENYIANIFFNTLKKYQTKIVQKKEELNFYKWAEFKLGRIVNIHSTPSGIDKISLNKEGEKIYPYVTRSGTKPNGIDSYVPKQNAQINKKNQITLGLDTQTVFFQDQDFYTGQNIQIISYNEINKYNALFLIGVLRNFIRQKFHWGGNGATITRLKEMSIFLPAKIINGRKVPDWNFMEKYIKSLPYSDKI